MEQTNYNGALQHPLQTSTISTTICWQCARVRDAERAINRRKIWHQL